MCLVDLQSKLKGFRSGTTVPIILHNFFLVNINSWHQIKVQTVHKAIICICHSLVLIQSESQLKLESKQYILSKATQPNLLNPTTLLKIAEHIEINKP